MSEMIKANQMLTEGKWEGIVFRKGRGFWSGSPQWLNDAVMLQSHDPRKPLEIPNEVTRNT